MRRWWPPAKDVETLPAEQPWSAVGQHTVNLLADAALGLHLKTMTESPIETAFGIAASKMLAGLYGDDFGICQHREQHQNRALRALMIPQFVWQRYRIDWAFRFRNREPQPLVFVECDGAEFHSTREQLARDRAKDDAAHAAGIPLVRFTGSEIVSAPDYCIMKFRLRAFPNWRAP